MERYVLIGLVLVAGILIGAGVSAQVGFDPVEKQIPLPIDAANESVIKGYYNLEKINVKAEYYELEDGRIEVCLNGSMFNNACNDYDTLPEAQGFLKERLEAVADAATKRQGKTKVLIMTEEIK